MNKERERYHIEKYECKLRQLQEWANANPEGQAAILKY